MAPTRLEDGRKALREGVANRGPGVESDAGASSMPTPPASRPPSGAPAGPASEPPAPVPGGDGAASEQAPPSQQAPAAAPPPPPGGTAPTFTTVFAALGQSCSGFACHAGGFFPAGGLDLGSRAAAYTALLAPAAGGSCPGDRVLAGDPDGSILVQRLEGSGCGTRMPQNGAPLSAQTLQLIRAWIAAGAPND